ncbi:hypothetical protein Pd630_LPD16045 (plasmid) [Rhodococcus opacus PD630]|nr:hypothetical protein Pd630_LPD16045 [Rhodococcus opacus PD630]
MLKAIKGKVLPTTRVGAWVLQRSGGRGRSAAAHSHRQPDRPSAPPTLTCRCRR